VAERWRGVGGSAGVMVSIYRICGRRYIENGGRANPAGNGGQAAVIALTRRHASVAARGR